MSEIHTMLEYPGIATVLGAKIIGRSIGQIADGYGEDPIVSDHLNIYKAILEKYPKDTMSMQKMFKQMVRNASDTTDDELDEAVAELPPAQQELWATPEDTSDKEKLKQSIPELTKLYAEAEPNADSWDDLPVIAQWSLLLAVENGIPDRIELYQKWVDEDVRRGKKDTNAMRLLRDAHEGQREIYDIVTKFQSDEVNIAALAAEAEMGTQVPVRTAKIAA